MVVAKFSICSQMKIFGACNIDNVLKSLSKWSSTELADSISTYILIYVHSLSLFVTAAF